MRFGLARMILCRTPVALGTVGFVLIAVVTATGLSFQGELADASSWWETSAPDDGEDGRAQRYPTSTARAASVDRAQRRRFEDEDERRMNRAHRTTELTLARLADRALEPEYLDAVETLLADYDLRPYTLFRGSPLEQAGGQAFTIETGRTAPHLFDLDAVVAPAGGSVFYFDELGTGDRSVVVVVPTRDWQEVILLVEQRTSYSDRTVSLPLMMKELSDQASFQIIAFGPYILEAELVTQPDDWDLYVGTLNRISPRIIEEVYGSRDIFRETIQEENHFTLWWGVL